MHAPLAALGTWLVTCLCAGRLLAAPVVWVVDDGEKVKRDATGLPLAAGTGNPVWKPGAPVSLFALRNETVAVQVVVQADATPLAGVTVDLDGLTGPGGAKIANGAGKTDPATFVGRPIERFVEHYFDVARASSTSGTGESLGWADGSGPPAGAWTGWMPDALIPVELAPAWSPYPMAVAASQNGVVWIDVMTAADQPPGTYTGNVVVKAGSATLATLPVQLDVLDATLPDRPLKTMLFYELGDLQRVGNDPAIERQLWMLYHRHRLSAMHSVNQAADLGAHLPALDGSLYTAANGYEGPGAGLGDGILSLGTYGSYGDPDASTLATVEAIADAVAAAKLFATTDVFVYATDEDCTSPTGMAWKTLVGGSSDANVKNVKIGWTCSKNPTTQPVDVPIVAAQAYDVTTAAAARAAGKDVWIYNGYRPNTGTFLTDAEATATRVNGWIAATFGPGRWFYWETAFWYDGNRGGHGPYDPFVTSETFHNADGDECQGDGVLVYPGKQVDMFTSHSIGLGGVIASIRLKNLRRGVEDAGYYQLAHAASARQAEAIAKGLLGHVLADARSGDPVSYPEAGKPYFDARKALADLIPRGPGAPTADGGAPTGGGGSSGTGGIGGGSGAGGAGAGGSSGAKAAGASNGCGCGLAANGAGGGGGAGALLLLALGAVRARARRR
jgi:hypothetical protein